MDTGENDWYPFKLFSPALYQVYNMIESRHISNYLKLYEHENMRI